jgi:kinesin family protein 4/21/27
MQSEWNFTLTLSMLEIYNETILDLLCLNSASSAKDKLDVRQTPEGNQVVGLSEILVIIIYLFFFTFGK